jgi:hypothetical protein
MKHCSLYLLLMYQSPDLVNNSIHTGWLDLRIARKVQSKGPPWHLAVIAGIRLDDKPYL